MDNKRLEVLKNVEYANLNREQQARLKEFESRFNSEFGEDFNIMVMKKDEDK
jgi:hypothetical protein